MKASVRFVVMQLALAVLLGLLSLFQGCSGAHKPSAATGAANSGAPAVISHR